jgi:hypothetical protein
MRVAADQQYLSCQTTVGRCFEHVAARKNRRSFENSVRRGLPDEPPPGKTGKWLIFQVLGRENSLQDL